MKNFIVFLFVISNILMLQAENLDEKLAQFGQENGKRYVQPFVNAVSANLNSGLYTTAKTLKPFRFGFFLHSSLSFLSSKDQSFLAQKPNISIDGNDLYEEEEIETATIFGDEGGTFHLNEAIPAELVSDEMEITMPDGLNTSIFPQFYPQFMIGLPAGNEITFRYFPSITVQKDIGKFSFFGIGLKHSLNYSILKLLPLDLAIQAMYQQIKVGDTIDIQSTHFNVQISKKILMWTFYGGIGFDITKLNANYHTDQYVYDEGSGQIESIPIDIDFSVENENPLRATVGLRYTFLLMHFYADYTLHQNSIVHAGLGISL